MIKTLFLLVVVTISSTYGQYVDASISADIVYNDLVVEAFYNLYDKEPSETNVVVVNTTVIMNIYLVEDINVSLKRYEVEQTTIGEPDYEEIFRNDDSPYYDNILYQSLSTDNYGEDNSATGQLLYRVGTVRRNR